MTGAPVRAILKLYQLYLHLLSVLYSTCIRIRAHFRSYLNPAAVPMTPLDMLAMPSPTFGVFGCWQIGNLLDQHAPVSLWVLYLYCLHRADTAHRTTTRSSAATTTEIRTKVNSSRQ